MMLDALLLVLTILAVLLSVRYRLPVVVLPSTAAALVMTGTPACDREGSVYIFMTLPPADVSVPCPTSARHW